MWTHLRSWRKSWAILTAKNKANPCCCFKNYSMSGSTFCLQRQCSTRSCIWCRPRTPTTILLSRFTFICFKSPTAGNSVNYKRLFLMYTTSKLCLEANWKTPRWTTTLSLVRWWRHWLKCFNQKWLISKIGKRTSSWKLTLIRWSMIKSLQAKMLLNHWKDSWYSSNS